MADVYARGKAIAVPVFGPIRARQWKFVLLGGLEQEAHEWGLLAACHNLMKLHGMQKRVILATQARLLARPEQPSKAHMRRLSHFRSARRPDNREAPRRPLSQSTTPSIW